jgi:YidC/Oxa1 family membrane protein insertase
MSWDFLINPMITLLTLFYSVFSNNIVLAIALMTILIRLATSPLLIQQQKSAAAMQVIQPKLRKLQEKYKNDREKMAAAQMELYREHNVNPAAGCLPLLVQLPILLALYATITYALGSTPYQLVDLSNRLLIPSLEPLVPLNKIWLDMDLTQTPTFEVATAPWALALPVLVLITTWLQSKLTIPNTSYPPTEDGRPNPAESMTKSMTTIMPLMFGFFALSFPIGLSIYFIVGNLVGIAQYTLMGKANWRGLLGLPEKPKPALAQGLASDDDISSIVARVNEKSKNGYTPSSNGTATRDVIKTKPKVGSSNGSVTKTKNRKKK